MPTTQLPAGGFAGFACCARTSRGWPVTPAMPTHAAGAIFCLPRPHNAHPARSLPPNPGCTSCPVGRWRGDPRTPQADVPDKQGNIGGFKHHIFPSSILRACLTRPPGGSSGSGFGVGETRAPQRQGVGAPPSEALPVRAPGCALPDLRFCGSGPGWAQIFLARPCR